jgi:hypothetical protein
VACSGGVESKLILPESWEIGAGRASLFCGKHSLICLEIQRGQNSQRSAENEQNNLRLNILLLKNGFEMPADERIITKRVGKTQFES